MQTRRRSRSGTGEDRGGASAARYVDTVTVHPVGGVVVVVVGGGKLEAVVSAAAAESRALLTSVAAVATVSTLSRALALARTAQSTDWSWRTVTSSASSSSSRTASFPARGEDSMEATAVTWQLKVPGHTLKNGESGEQRQVEMSRGAG